MTRKTLLKGMEGGAQSSSDEKTVFFYTQKKIYIYSMYSVHHMYEVVNTIYILCMYIQWKDKHHVPHNNMWYMLYIYTIHSYNIILYFVLQTIRRYNIILVVKFNNMSTINNDVSVFRYMTDIIIGRYTRWFCEFFIKFERVISESNIPISTSYAVAHLNIDKHVLVMMKKSCSNKNNKF